MPTEKELAEAQQQMAQAQFTKDADAIEKLGRDTYGAATFDHDVDRLSNKLGPGLQTLTAIASGFDSPHQVLHSIANDENRLDAISKMTPNQAAIEVARVEASLSPNGVTRGGRDPAWKNLGKNSGILDNHAWNSGQSDKLTEEQFQENWEHRQRQRAARSPQPLGSRARRG